MQIFSTWVNGNVILSVALGDSLGSLCPVLTHTSPDVALGDSLGSLCLVLTHTSPDVATFKINPIANCGPSKVTLMFLL
jgi:hypothetical protein